MFNPHDKTLSFPNKDKDLARMVQQQMNSFKVSDTDVVICNKCQSEFFVSAVRLAKSKVDLKNEAIGLLHERPYVFCAECKTRLPDDIAEIKTKKSLEDVKNDQ